jgi:valyl-tRNA synthetase
MNRAIAKYRYHEAANIIWHFIYDDFCDWYIEFKKIDAAGWDRTLTAFDGALRLLHPLMPFITEELWHRIGEHEGQSISTQPYPQFDPALYNAEAEREIALLQAVITAARGIRADLSLDPKLPLEGTISIPVDFETVERLTRVKFTVGEVARTGAVRSTADFDLSLSVPAAQLEAQRRRLEKEKEQLEKNIANSRRQLGDETFLGKAPAKVVDSIRAKLAEYETQLAKVNESLNA